MDALRINVIDLILPATETDTIDFLQSFYFVGAAFSANFRNLWQTQRADICDTIKKVFQGICESFSRMNIATLTFAELSAGQQRELCLFELLLRTGLIF